MIKFWVIAVLVFVLFMYIIARLSIKKYKKENSEKMWKQWGMKSAYWRGVGLVSLLLTFVVMYVLKLAHFVEIN